MHIIQSPRVGQLLPYRMRRVAAVVSIPRVLGQVGVVRIIPITESGRGPCPARILPLRLRRQPKMTACWNSSRRLLALGEFAAVVGGVEPRDLLHRTVRVTLEATRIAAHHRQIFPLGHLILPHPKPTADRHRRLRTLRVTWWAAGTWC